MTIVAGLFCCRHESFKRQAFFDERILKFAFSARSIALMHLGFREMKLVALDKVGITKMLKLMFATVMAGSVLAASIAPASAHYDSINAKQARQAKSIERGRATGAITWREGLKLRAEQRRIKRLERQFRKSDGRLTYKERKILNHKLKHAKRHIYQEKHDSYRRLKGFPRVGH